MLFNEALIELLHTDIVFMLDSSKCFVMKTWTFLHDHHIFLILLRRKMYPGKAIFKHFQTQMAIIFYLFLVKNITDLINACATISAHGVQCLYIV